MIILDKPTSSLDPNSEFDLFENFRERINHLAALVISPRIPPVSTVAYILVVSLGVICESGKRDELIKRGGGVYCQMFNKQSHHYREMET